MPRFAHKSTDDLSAEAWRIMRAGFRARKTYAGLVLEIEAATGEVVPERTVARRGIEWRNDESRRQVAREQIEAMVAVMKNGDTTSAEMVQALAVEALLQDPEAFSQADPLKVQAQNLRAEELRLKRDELDLRKQSLTLDVKKFETLQAREARAIKEADALARRAESGEQLTAEDLGRIRSIYGLEG